MPELDVPRFSDVRPCQGQGGKKGFETQSLGFAIASSRFLRFDVPRFSAVRHCQGEGGKKGFETRGLGFAIASSRFLRLWGAGGCRTQSGKFQYKGTHLR